MRKILNSLIGLILAPTCLWAATYSVNTNAAGEAVLDRALTSSHQGLTKTQVLQRFVNAALRALSEQQQVGETRELDEKLALASSAAKTTARNAINASIAVPTVTPISNQTHTVGQAVNIPLVATDPDDRSLEFRITGLPNGVVLLDGALVGTLTTAGTFSVEVRAHKFTDIFGSTTFSWQVNNP